MVALPAAVVPVVTTVCCSSINPPAQAKQNGPGTYTSSSASDQDTSAAHSDRCTSYSTTSIESRGM